MKALKFLGVAVLACSMLFVSCKKDKQYTITVNSNNAEWGTVTGGGTYACNATATLTATAKDGYVFSQWNDGNTTNPRTITVTANATYTATFVEKGTPAPGTGVTVSFNGTTWNATYFAVDDQYVSVDGSLYNAICKDLEALATEPYVTGYSASELGTTVDDSLTVCYMFYKENYYDTYNYGGTDYAKWQPYSFSQNISAIDLNAHTISSLITAEVYNLETYVTTQQLEVKNLGINMSNATWEILESSKGTAKGHGIVRK